MAIVCTVVNAHEHFTSPNKTKHNFMLTLKIFQQFFTIYPILIIVSTLYFYVVSLNEEYLRHLKPQLLNFMRYSQQIIVYVLSSKDMKYSPRKRDRLYKTFDDIVN